MSPLTAAIGALLSLILGALFSGLESHVLASNRLQITAGKTDRTKHVRDAYRLLATLQSTIDLAAMGNVVCLVIAAACVNSLVMHYMDKLAYVDARGIASGIISVLLLAPAYLLISVVASKRYFEKYPDSSLLQAASPLLRLVGLFVPLMQGLTQLIRKPLLRHSSHNAVEEKLTAEDLHELFGARDRPPTQQIDKRMIVGIFGLEQTIVREIMQPLVNVAAMPRPEATPERLATTARESGYSRIPVYTKSIVNIDGCVDVLQVLRAREHKDLHGFVTQPYYVPETMRADKLMRKMIHDRVDMAIVVDEFGGTVGLVTREDVLEEVVGEIEDEFDPMRPTVLPQQDGSFLVDGRMDIDDVNERFSLTLPNEDFDTLGGFIYDEVGRIPRVGDVVENERLRLEVMSMDGKQIERVKLHVSEEAPEEEA